MNLLDAIARRAMGPPRDPSTAGQLGDRGPLSRQRGGVPAPRPVLQFLPFPVTLDAKLYGNARSTSNPAGDLRSLFALRSLVDPLPAFARYYNPSGASTEQVYWDILDGADTSGDSTFAATLLGNARKAFAENTFENMDGTPGAWRPVFASPEDWADFSNEDRFHDLEIDLGGPDQPDGAYDLISGSPSMQLSVGGQDEARPLDPSTKIRSLKMKYMLVSFQRPWFNRVLFETAGWSLAGQLPGFCSSGDLNANTGTMPLLPSAMLLAKHVALEVDWGGSDGRLIASAGPAGQSVSLGPFALGESPSAVQLVAWISTLVPFSPKDSDLAAGSLLISNRGAFICRYSVNWRQGGRVSTIDSGNLPALAAKSVALPPDSVDITVTIDVMTWPAPEVWKTVTTLSFPAPVRKCFELTGETFNVTFAEVPCPQ